MDIDIDILQLLESAIEKHKVILNTPITDKYGDKEGVYTRLNRIANELAKIEYNEGNETPVKQFERYYNSIIYDFIDLPPLRQFQRAIITQKDSLPQDILVQNFCSQLIETIIDQYAELIAYHKVLDELHRNLNPQMYINHDDAESPKQRIKRPPKKPFNVKTYMEKEYQGGLARMFDYWKYKEDEKGKPLGYFKYENSTTFIDRCNNTSGPKVDAFILEATEATESSDRLVLICMLRAIQEILPEKSLKYQSFVKERFSLEAWDRMINQHSFKDDFKEIVVICKKLIKEP